MKQQLIESLLRKIAKGKRPMTFRTAEIIIRGRFDQAQLDQDLAATMTIHWDKDGLPTLINVSDL